MNLSPSAPKTGAPPILDNQASSSHHAVKVGAVEWVLTGLILFLTGASFLPVLKNNFVDRDDKILLSTKYQELDWTAVRSILTDFATGLYQPLSWMTIAFDQAFWRRDPFGYHLTSLLIHCASAIILFFVTHKLLAAIHSDPPPADDANQKIAAFVATLIFALHPLRVEAVASAGARDDVLSGLFLLLSILCYLQTEGSREAPFWRGWTAPSLIFYALSLLSRPTGVTLPVVLLFLDVFLLRRLPGTPRDRLRLQFREILSRKFPFFVLAIGSVFVTLFTGQQGDPASAEGYPSLPKRFVYLLIAPAFYLWKTILPFGLSPIYELTTAFEILAMLMTAAITVGVLVVRRRWPALLTIWFTYLIMLLGVLAIASVDSELLADRQTYLPSLPLAVSAAVGLFHALHMLRTGSARRSSVMLGCGVAAVICLGLGYLTWKQTQVWQNSEQLWTHAIAVSGSSGAHKHMAARLEAEGRDEDAIEHYRRAILAGPSDWDIHYRLGLLLQGQARMQEAIDHYIAAAQSKPGAAEAHNQLAFALMGQGKLKEAAEHFEKVLELTSAAATNTSMNPKRAKHFRKVYELDPDRGEAHFRLGGIAALQGEYDKAVDHFEHAVKISPDFAEAFLNLGLVLATQGDLDAAVVNFRKAIDIRPTYAQAHESLGRALAELGKKEEAAKHLQEAIRLLKLSPAPR